MEPVKPLRLIWSACHTGRPGEDYLHTVIDKAAAEGVHGIELSGTGIEPYIAYTGYPALAAQVDRKELEERQAMLDRLTGHAAAAGLRFGLWHHEIHGPRNLLDLLPDLRAADGLIDLDSPALYRLITGRLREFFQRFPRVDELVLTMTETGFPVFRRPFCTIPVAERVRRLLAAVLEAVESEKRVLVIRPFSALREDELHVREAVENLKSGSIVMMYKTEPFDWHPFLMNEPLIGSIPSLEARAETDAGAEYYGQSVIPCSYIRHIEYRLRAALDKGARSVTIRVDRGARHPALGLPINEANVLVPTRWLKTGQPLPVLWDAWFKAKYGQAVPGLFDLFERTFEVIGKTLYIDQQSFTHNLFPDLKHAKHVQAFNLFEENVPLDHMRRNWGVLADRRTLTHEALLAEKEEALRLALRIVEDFDRHAAVLPEEAKRELRAALERLVVLARACLAFARTVAAHLEDVWNRPARTTEPFDTEAARLKELADEIDLLHGPGFWIHLSLRMRDVADGLAAERRMETPLRKAVEESPGLIDYVLCGFASEGHRFGKMLHTGQALAWQGRLVRETGMGDDEGISYRLQGEAGRPHRLVLTLAADGKPRPGRIRMGAVEHPFDAGVTGPVDFAWDLQPAEEAGLEVSIWGTTALPVRVAEIRLERGNPQLYGKV